MKGQIDEPIYTEANNNFLKDASSFGTTLVSSLGTTLNILLNVKSTWCWLHMLSRHLNWVEQQVKHSSPISDIYY